MWCLIAAASRAAALNKLDNQSRCSGAARCRLLSTISRRLLTVSGLSLRMRGSMACEFEHRVVEVIQRLLGASLGTTPDWLIRPGRDECLCEWDRISAIYTALTDLELPAVMRSVERRTVDAVLITDRCTRILEVDEEQHFNQFRAATFECYPDPASIAFDWREWHRLSRHKTRLEGGGFAKEKPPLFPGINGRHKQRAFRDALCDLVPPLHGYAPTLRINSYEARAWIFDPNASEKMGILLSGRL